MDHKFFGLTHCKLHQQKKEPLPIEKQLAVIYAGVRGHLDNVLISEIPKFEKEFLEFLRANHPNILNEIKR